MFTKDRSFWVFMLLMGLAVPLSCAEADNDEDSSSADANNDSAGIDTGSGMDTSAAADSSSTASSADTANDATASPCGDNTLVPGDPMTINWEGDHAAITYSNWVDCTTDLDSTTWNLTFREPKTGGFDEFEVSINLFNSDVENVAGMIGHPVTLASEFGDGGATVMQVKIDKVYMADPAPYVYIDAIDENGLKGCIYGDDDVITFDYDAHQTTHTGPIVFACQDH